MENEKLVELIQAGIDPKANMTTLYKQNRGFMYQQASRYQNLIEMDDIMQEMYFILDKAVQSFDPSRGTFITWLGNSIRFYLPRQLSALYEIRIPEYLSGMILSFRRFSVKHLHDTGEYPSDQDIIDALNISQDQLDYIRQIEKIMAKESIYKPIADGITIEDSLADDSDMYEMIDDTLDDEIYSEVLNEAIQSLTDKQKEVIRLRMKGLTLEQTSRELKIKSRQAVQVREKTALKQLRNHLIDNGTMLMLYEDAYKGSLSSFNHTFTSTPERIAIKGLMMDNKA